MCTHERDKKCIRILDGKPEDRRPVEKPKYRWKDNIKIALKEKGSESVVLFHLAQANAQWHALENMVIKYVGFQVLTMVTTKSSIFWGIMLSSLEKVNLKSARICHLHL
jgi:ribosome biogenesis protein Nip4